MKENGVNAVELSRVTGVGSSTISAWKKGLQKPSAEAIIKLADYFNVTTDYLLGKSDNLCPPDAPPISPRIVTMAEDIARLSQEDQGMVKDFISRLKKK